MIFENPVTKEKIELDGREAEFFEETIKKFNSNIYWWSFENFAFSPRSPIYARRRSYGQLNKDPLYRGLQDMWLQLGVNQRQVADDRVSKEGGFCRDE